MWTEGGRACTTFNGDAKDKPFPVEFVCQRAGDEAACLVIRAVENRGPETHHDTSSPHPTTTSTPPLTSTDVPSSGARTTCSAWEPFASAIFVAAVDGGVVEIARRQCRLPCVTKSEVPRSQFASVVVPPPPIGRFWLEFDPLAILLTLFACYSWLST